MPAQLAVIESIQETTINYEHVPIFKDNKGKKLAKRSFSDGIYCLRRQGMRTSQIIGFLASSLGMVPKGSELSCEELLSHLKLNKDFLNKIINTQPKAP